MDLHVALHTRRTIHTWTDGPEDPAVLDRALRAAHMAPCHRLTWPWRFHVVGPQTREMLIPIAITEKERKAPLADAQRASLTRAWRAPTWLVLVSYEHGPKPDVTQENYAATACAIQNFMLSIHADGMGTKWGTGGVVRAPETCTLLGLDPERATFAGLLWVGHPAEVPEIPRPPIEGFIHRLP
ncbi:MAG TPA: nitroreductase family protein [Myxococcota bacterium]|nr:nitroreductase family protein [Myxococcota bacterium]